MAITTRRTFLRRTSAATGALAAAGPLGALTTQALAKAGGKAVGYGPLVLKTDPATGRQLLLPERFDFVVVQRQGEPMSDGRPVPGIFDGMGAYKAKGGRTILIRNHENRERAGETKVETGALEYDPAAFGGNTKLVVDPAAIKTKRAPYVLESFAILGGTSTNCAGGVTPWDTWIACEEVVKGGANGKRHGYVFEMDAHATGPVPAIPAPKFGRFAHEAIAWSGGLFYLTEDQSRSASTGLGAALYRFVPTSGTPGVGNIADLDGRLEALAVKGRPNANLDLDAAAGQVFDVEWVPVPEPDHGDDTNGRTDRVPGFTPTRVQAYDNGAAVFDRQEGAWTDDQGRVWFDCTSGGPANAGQIWVYDPRTAKLTLVFQSTGTGQLDAPDNIVIVPGTGDVLAQEDGGGDQFIRGITADGLIYDFARTVTSDSEFCGGCFDPRHDVLYVNQQGGRGSLPGGPDPDIAITYAIFGPFASRNRTKRS